MRKRLPSRGGTSPAARTLMTRMSEGSSVLPDDVAATSKVASLSPDHISAMLRRRGFTYMGGNPRERLVFPQGSTPETESVLYNLLHKYSFRLFLRDIIKQKKSFSEGDVGGYSSVETVRRYVNALISIGVLRRHQRRLSLISPTVYSFGDTLEWYVAGIFMHEYGCPSQWGIKLRELQSGGDLDVVALADGRFVYVEVKSSPPKHIEQNEISAFLDRVIELEPDIAIFIEDTKLRMKDKIVVMFENELATRWPHAGLSVSRIRGELFAIGRRLFIVNSKPDVPSNLGYCLKRVLSVPLFPL